MLSCQWHAVPGVGSSSLRPSVLSASRMVRAAPLMRGPVWTWWVRPTQHWGWGGTWLLPKPQFSFLSFQLALLI